MTLIQRYSCRAAGLLLIVLTALFSGACSSDGNGGVSTGGDAEWKNSSTVSAASGSATIVISGLAGTPWRAEIKEGAAWCSFKLGDYEGSTVREGTVSANSLSNLLYVYYAANTGGDERIATIEFSFAGGEPFTRTLIQIAAGSNDDPYAGGHADYWPELPERKTSDDYIYLSHFAPLASGARARNYSFCFDKTLHVSHWVAYPLHYVYRGSVNRQDDFGYDPKVNSSYQANLGRGSYNGPYDRGHQLPSADRLATVDMNSQTFYATNMTPQLNRLNRDMWANLEAKVRTYMCNDTLYVVTGCYYATTSTTTTDKSGMVCPIPTNYFKVLLRTVSGNTGKRIKDCSASELKSIGFWVEQKSYGDIEPPRSICMSVAEIEDKTGFTFFPQVPEEVKQQNNPSQWAL